MNGTCARRNSKLLFAWLFPLIFPGVLSLAVCPVPTAHAAAAGEEMLVAITGALPAHGRVVIRSGLAWLTEENSLFSAVRLTLAEGLTERGLIIVPVDPSQKARLPEGTEAIRKTALPSNKGMRQRVMSVDEAIARMKAMQLAREGRLPQARFGENGGARKTQSRIPAMTHPEMIRFAISQEQSLPALRGHITIPGRTPDEIRTTDPALADYALTVAFAMLWPAAGAPDVPKASDVDRGLAVGWHLMELTCYDLAPTRENKAHVRCWTATVQRVAYSAYLWSSLPDMARAVLNYSQRCIR